MFCEKNRLAGTLLFTFLLPAAYAQNASFTTTSAGNWTSVLSPNSIAAGFGVNITSATTTATSLPLSTTLGGVTVTITDSAGVKSPAPLYMVSPGQINYLIPSNVAPGPATVNVTGASRLYTGTLQVSGVAPAIFSANMSGLGVAAAQIIRVSASGQITTQMIYQQIFQPWIIFGYVPLPVSLSPATDSIYLILYGTGIRNHSANPVTATINGVNVPVLFASAHPTLPGLDQVNLGPLPQTLAGTGKLALNIVVLVDGISTNTTTITIQ